MPTVPRRDPDGVQLRALPGAQLNVQPPAEAFGAGPAAAGAQQALGRLNQSVVELFAAEQKRADETAMVEFSSNLTRLETEMLYGEKGALRLQSKAAIGSYDPTMQGFAKGAEELLKGLANDRQREAGRNLLDKVATGMDRTLQQHIARETERHTVEVGQTNIANATQLAVSGVTSGDSTAFERALLQADSAIDALGRGRLDEETIKRTKLETNSGMVSSILSQFLAQNRPNEAELFLKQHGGLLTAKDRERIEPAIRAKATENKVLGISQAAVQEKNPDGTVNLSSALTTARDRATAAGLDAAQVQTALGTVRSMAGLEDAALADRHQAQDRDFFNAAVQIHRSGAPMETAIHELFSNRNLARDNADRVKKEDLLISLYRRGDDFYERMMNSDPNRAAEWRLASSIIDANIRQGETITDPNTGAKLRVRDVIKNQAKRDLASIPTQELVPAVQKLIEKVPKTETWWPFDRERRGVQEFRTRFDRLEREKRAREFLSSKFGRPPTQQELNRWMAE